MQVFINFVKQQSDGIRDPSITPHAFSPIPADLEESLDDPPAFIEGCNLTRSQVRKDNKILLNNNRWLNCLKLHVN